MSSKGENGSYFMTKLIATAPELSEIVLDRSCSFSAHQPDHPDFEMTFDFKYLEGFPESKSIVNDLAVVCKGEKSDLFFAPKVMAKHGRQQLISHPIIKSLFALKWQRVGRYLYYFSFLLYMIFLVALNISVLTESQS